jgi:dolichyl-phosphate beta-glucosyltransferase
VNTGARGGLRLVVPCYNEAARIPRETFLSFVRTTPAATLVFVDDGSTDGTAAVLDDMAACGAGRMDVLRLDRNRGKAEAVRQGVLASLAAGARFVGYWDADLSTPLDAVTGFMSIFEQQPTVEIVMGARVKLLGRAVHRRQLRHYLGRVFATAASLVLGIAVYDTQCGAKLFRVSNVVEGLFQKPFRSRWVFDVEILARYIAAVGRSGAESSIHELPLEEWNDVPGSKLRMRHWVLASWDLARIAIAAPRRDTR